MRQIRRMPRSKVREKMREWRWVWSGVGGRRRVGRDQRGGGGGVMLLLVWVGCAIYLLTARATKKLPTKKKLNQPAKSDSPSHLPPTTPNHQHR